VWWANTAAIEATQSLFSRVALELATTYTKGLDALQSTAALQLNASKADLGQSLTDEISAALSSVSAQQAEVVEEVSALTATLADLQSEGGRPQRRAGEARGLPGRQQGPRAPAARAAPSTSTATPRSLPCLQTGALTATPSSPARRCTSPATRASSSRAACA